MSTPRFVCICADDFGLSDGINEAALELAEHSRLSAIGCMVRRDFWLPGSRLLRQLDPRRVDIGLHLDLSFPGRASQPERTLWDLILASYLGLLSVDRIRSEIRGQLDRFEDSMGRAPAFVDGHRHVHQLPIVSGTLIAELKQRYRQSPPWLRSTAPEAGHALPHSKADVIHALGGKALLQMARRHEVPMSNRLLGVYDFSRPFDYGTALTHWLQVSRTGDVLMCHPSAGESPSVPHGAARRREYLALCALPPLALAGGDGPTLAPLSRQWRRPA